MPSSLDNYTNSYILHPKLFETFNEVVPIRSPANPANTGQNPYLGLSFEDISDFIKSSPETQRMGFNLWRLYNCLAYPERFADFSKSLDSVVIKPKRSQRFQSGLD
jgi:hypothetical protein